MTELHKALMAFWQQFGLPVFLAGCVVDQTPFPYIVIDVVDGTPAEHTLTTAYSWHKRKPEDSFTPVMLERLDLMDKVSAAIPPCGCFLPYEGGYAILDRNGANFLSYTVDATDPDVIGGRFAYAVRFF